MFTPNSIIEEIKDTIDLYELAGEYTTLNSNGWGLCPLHQETNPSFHVTKDQKHFTCFGCLRCGDQIDFTRYLKGYSFVEAVRYLYDKINPGFEFPESFNFPNEEELLLQEIRNTAAVYYHTKLTPDGKKYLIDERGLTETTLTDYLVGQADGTLNKFLIDERKYSVDLCIKSKLVKQRDDGTIEDFLKDRIVFPNLRGSKVVDFTGLSPKENKQKKYLNLPGEIKYLYYEPLTHQKYTIIVEGILDSLSLKQAGYCASAIKGKYYKDSARKRLEQKCDIIYICFDGDPEGEKGALEIAKTNPRKYKIIILPHGEDPNSFFLKHTKEEFQCLFDDAVDVITFHISELTKVKDNLNPGSFNAIIKLLAKVNKIEADFYIAELKEKLELKSSTIQSISSQLVHFRKKSFTRKRNNRNLILDADPPGSIELVYNNGRIRYMVFHDNRPLIVDHIKVNGKVHVPPRKKHLPFLVANGNNVLAHIYSYQGHDENEINSRLFLDIAEKLRTAVTLPDTYLYELLALWVMHTYFFDRFSYSPFVYFHGGPGLGKTRILKALIFSAARGFLQGSLRPANIIRCSGDLNATLGLDCYSIWSKALKNDSQDLLLGRFEKDHYYSRVTNLDLGSIADSRHYPLFGPTAIASNERVHPVFESRGIKINMIKDDNIFEENVTPESFLGLKERLVALKVKYYSTQFPHVNKPTKGRLGDVMQPLYTILNFFLKDLMPDANEKFLWYLRRVEEESKSINSNTIEVKIIKALLELRHAVSSGRLSTKEITDTINLHNPISDKQISTISVGRVLRRLGFTTDTKRRGRSELIFDNNLLLRLANEFNINTGQQ